MAERHVRLKAPPGVDGVEYGGEIFFVKNGHILVPIECEAPLTRQPTPGFKFPDEPTILVGKGKVKK